MVDAKNGSRSLGDHPIVVIIGILAGVTAIAAFVIQLIGREDSADTSSPTVVSTEEPSTGPSGTQPGSTEDTSTGDPGPSDGSSSGGEPTTPPSGIDLALALQTDTCSVVPGGGLEGGDVMTVLFRTVSVGDVDYAGAVQATALSDSGLQGQSTGPLSSGSASSFVQVEFAGQDYGRTHEFTIEIAPLEDVVDVDLSNNSATVMVELPPVRDPDTTFDPCA